MIRLALRSDRGLGVRAFVGALTGALVLAVGVSAIAMTLDRTGVVGSSIIILFGINAIMVVGFQTFVGNTGIMSFGHVAFMALGAYAAGIVALPKPLKAAFLPQLPHWLASIEFSLPLSLAVGGVVAMLVALGFGVFVMRTSPTAISIITFAILVIVNEVLSNATSLTRGTETFSGVPADTTLGWVFGVFVAFVVGAAVVKWSRFGLDARAVRDDPIAAQASGIRVVPSRVYLFAISAFITGVGGALWAHFLTAFSPSSFFLDQVVVIVAMAILGGLESMSGAVVGAVALSVINEGLRRLEGGFSIGVVHVPALDDVTDLILGLGIIALLRWRPHGLLGDTEVTVDAPARDAALVTGEGQTDGGSPVP